MLFVLPPISALAQVPPPEALSLYPLGGPPRSTLQATVRGKNLAGVSGAWVDCDAIQAQARGISAASPTAKKQDQPDKTQTEGPAKNEREDEVYLEVRIGPQAKIGVHTLRVFSPSGVSGPLALYVDSEPAINETGRAHDSSESAQQ